MRVNALAAKTRFVLFFLLIIRTLSERIGDFMLSYRMTLSEPLLTGHWIPLPRESTSLSRRQIKKHHVQPERAQKNIIDSTAERSA